MPQYVQSIERAARVLTTLSEAGNPMGVTEIAGAVNLGKSTVHRILTSLMQANFVRTDPESRQYSLGYGLLQLTAGLLRGSEISITALPFLRDLRRATEETVSLNVLDHDHRTVVDRLDTTHEIRYVAEIGRPLPLHVGAGGKAILAFMDVAEVRRIQALAKLTSRQIRELDKELADIRAIGSAYTLGERLPGAGSISAPVFNHENQVIASVNVLCLESRLNASTVRNFRELVRKTSKDISRALGWSTDKSPKTRDRVTAG
jgi:DNA-binding IclR family transcriptional regulator